MVLVAFYQRLLPFQPDCRKRKLKWMAFFGQNWFHVGIVEKQLVSPKNKVPKKERKKERKKES